MGALRGSKNKAVRRWSIAAASRQELPGTTLTALGDSFTEGAEAFPRKLAERMGWAVRYVDGQGGTGYVAGAMTYPERIRDLPPADVLLISGGYNDTWNVVTGTKTITQFQAAIDATLDAARQIAPKVVVIGPFWTRREETPAEAYAINDYVHGAALARSFRFVDVLTDNWVTPENRAGIISEDDTHPSQAGQDYIADRLAVLLVTSAPAR
jgi:lysophospholipase L1-like esterase